MRPKGAFDPRFAKVTELQVPIKLKLTFARSVSLRDARETARKLMDGMGEVDVDVVEELDEAALVCAQLRRKVTLVDR